LAQPGSATAWHAVGHEFKSRNLHEKKRREEEMPHGNFIPYANLSAWLVLLFWIVVILVILNVRKRRHRD
jgi:hypothetical protein